MESVEVNSEFWRGKRVFLTGHTGFKGGWLSLWLHSMGAEVHGYALNPPTETVTENQFDTIYHEHYSYLSLTAVKRIFERNGLSVFDVEELPTHGGSLRVYAQRKDTGVREPSQNVAKLLERETAAGMNSTAFYAGFQAKANKVKNDLLNFLIEWPDTVQLRRATPC